MNNIKKFEDFLDRMQGLLDEAKKRGHIIVRVEDLEDAFPELEEREDEKVRKAIINFLKGNIADDDDVTVPEMITWLEKQGPINKEKYKKD